MERIRDSCLECLVEILLNVYCSYMQTGRNHVEQPNICSKGPFNVVVHMPCTVAKRLTVVFITVLP